MQAHFSSTSAHSRFLQRWLAADPARPAQLVAMKQQSMATLDLEAALQAEAALLPSGAPLDRAMRRLRNSLICTLIERDLDGSADLNEVVTAMTRFADFAIARHLDVLMAAAVAAHGMPIGEESGQPQQMMVVAMGKQGGFELNVSSDIDLIFVYPEQGETHAVAGQKSLSNHEFFVKLGRKLIGALSEVTQDGFTFRVDMALRPNGASGPLAASLATVEQYLIVQGREWERYAWVKARAVTGEAQDIAALDAIVRPFVFRRYLDFGVIDAIRNMHAQVRAEVNRQERLHPDRSNNVKLGRGGIREIEFLAQVFQLIRGGRDAALRERSTRATLVLLGERELMPMDAVEGLLSAYTFLRNLEHRLQYIDDAQTHTVPAGDAERLALAQMMGLPDAAALIEKLDATRAWVAGQFDQMFSDKSKNGGDADPDDLPSMDVAADAGNQDSRDMVAERLAALGFDDPAAGAARLVSTWQAPRLQAMNEASRTRLLGLINLALPLIARITAEAHIGSQAATLGRLLDFFEAIARRSAYLALLTEYPHTLERVIRMMHASGWAATFLTRHPILLDELMDDRNSAMPDAKEIEASLHTELAAAAGDTERQLDILRETHHAALFRLLALDLAGELTVERLADHLSALADAIVAATVQAAWNTIATHHRDVPRFAVIAYGKLGGKELGYVSDLDVIFLYDDDDQDAPANYAKLAQRFITWMTAHTAAGILFDIDTALRPDGASGMLVSSISAFARYQTNSAWLWEHQALTRARFCAGDTAIGAQFEAIREQVLRIDRSARMSESGGDPLASEVVAMRQRMRAAHINHTALFDLKQDAGGMIDVEFIDQYLVLRHAFDYPQLTINVGNIALLQQFSGLGLIDANLAAEVAEAYRTMRRLQHQMRLQGQDTARVAPGLVEGHAASVITLWQALFPA
ncbi:MAG: bifunctional [glutamate--ammonia ligase]-adenylyl-L-tyrosine phosphorylase/[glutamate--ammonia-ligase] adenylyltransferase [Pseudomonadota bacterium]|nr:bifunctional [glutamate--ammonia ligase]-adenylyl-L-tyrosine phosphorylase/[glutamate--ammonia-ligase] adenylyltransferase [Pseudomonadota bacterium]